MYEVYIRYVKKSTHINKKIHIECVFRKYTKKGDFQNFQTHNTNIYISTTYKNLTIENIDFLIIFINKIFFAIQHQSIRKEHTIMPKIPTSQLTQALLVSHMHISASTDNKYFNNPKNTNLTEDIWFYHDDDRYFIYNNTRPDITQDKFLESIEDLPKDLQDLLFLMFENKLLYIIINDIDIIDQDNILDVEEIIVSEPWLPIYHDDDCIYTPTKYQFADTTDLCDKYGNPVRVGDYLHIDKNTCVIVEPKGSSIPNTISYRHIFNPDTKDSRSISELNSADIEIVATTSAPIKHVIEVKYQKEKRIVEVTTPVNITKEDIAAEMDKVYVNIFGKNENRQHRADYSFYVFMCEVCEPNNWYFSSPAPAIEFSWSD